MLEAVNMRSSLMLALFLVKAISVVMVGVFDPKQHMENPTHRQVPPHMPRSPIQLGQMHVLSLPTFDIPTRHIF